MGVKFYWENKGILDSILTIEVDRKTWDDFKHMVALITLPIWCPIYVVGYYFSPLVTHQKSIKFKGEGQ